jgi:hypothetical protein
MNLGNLLIPFMAASFVLATRIAIIGSLIYSDKHFLKNPGGVK